MLIPFPKLRRFATVRNLPSVVIDRQMEMEEDDPDVEIIDFDSERIGYLAAKRLWERMHNPSLEPQRILIPCKKLSENKNGGWKK